MKKLIYAFASLSLIALVGLASCKKSSEPSTEFKLNSSNISLSVGETFILKAQNASGNIEWSVSDATIAKITPSNDGAECKVEGVKEGSATVTAKNGDKTATCAVTVEGAEKEDAPEIAAPGENLTTIAIRVPVTGDMRTCNGLYAIGAVTNSEGVTIGWNHNVAGAQFKLVEGTTSWYVFTFKNDGKEGTLGGMKVCALPQDPAAADWAFQWGTNSDEKENVTLVKEDEDVEFELENQVEPKLIAAPANKVIYIDVDAWQTKPCAPLNPAGPATIKATPDAGRGVVSMALVGNFTGEEAQDWKPEAPFAEMTKDGDSFTWSGNVPSGLKFKILYKTASMEAYTWDFGSKANQDMPLTNAYTTDDSTFQPALDEGGDE